MYLRTYQHGDFDRLLALTIDVFGPFFEESFRSIVGDVIFMHQHGNWREDYRGELTGRHDPEHDKHVIVAVTEQHRRHGVAQAMCKHIFDSMRCDGVEVVTIGTGGDPFHAPARSFYQSLGMTPLPVVVYFKEL